MAEKFPEATNFQYVDRVDAVMEKKIFLNNLNSYHGSSLAKTLLKLSLNGDQKDGNLTYKIYGTLQKSEGLGAIHGVEILNPNKVSFFDSIIACDVIIYDISQEFSQLSEAKSFLKYFEDQLADKRVEGGKHLILISTIMTWSQTPQQEDVLTDSNYRKRRPDSCYVNHLILERDVINLQKKFKNLIETLVICPGIIYGGRQDLFHFLYKKCYFNNIQPDIFLPATNHLPLIYLEDFTRILVMNVQKFPDPKVEYILAVQPESIAAKDVVETFAEAAGGPDVRIKICAQEEIFLMDEELMTVRNNLLHNASLSKIKVFNQQQRVFNHLTLDLRLESDFLKTFDFTMTGFNLELNSHKLTDEFHDSRNLKPIKILIDGSPFAYQTELAEMLARFYSLHRVQPECFLENFCQRLVS